MKTAATARRAWRASDQAEATSTARSELAAVWSATAEVVAPGSDTEDLYPTRLSHGATLGTDERL